MIKMVSQNISENNVPIFDRLESIYYALSLSAQDSIVIPNPEFDEEEHKEMPIDISHVYFNVEDDDGKEIVNERIKLASEDIVGSYRAHREMQSIFYGIEVSSREKSSDGIYMGVYHLCDKVLSYSGFVQKHKKILEDKQFLEYPNYRGGNISYRKGADTESSISSLSPFNPERSYLHLFYGIKNLCVLADKFKAGHGDFYDNIFTGHLGSSLEKNLELTRMLLREHLDFNVEG